MTANQWLSVLLSIPLVTSLLCFAARLLGPGARVAATTLHLLGTALLLVLSLGVAGTVLYGGPATALSGWLHVDALGAIFLGLLGLVGFLTGFYSIGYMGHELEEGEIDVGQLCLYFGIFNLFLFTMLLAVTANNIIMMWVAIEATTLGSAFLVGFYHQRSSLEAAWKYIIICTVGVAFGLYGVVLVYSNAASVMGDHGGAVFWTVLMGQAKSFDPTLMRLAFVFVIIGFGTKTGLFPMHAWLPDAHSEAPSPVSALLSAVLLNCALLVIIRFYLLVSRAIGPAFPQMLFMAFGLMSLAVAAFFIVSQGHMKRLLAYSSVENMGLIVLGLGLGGPLGVFAALLHTINHSLAKALLFCGSGNVLLKYGTPDLGAIKGLLKSAPLTAMLFGAGALALGGIPPFNVFFSEFLLVTAGIKAGHAGLIVLCLVLLTVVLAGLVRMVAGSLFGPAPDQVEPGEPGALTLVPMAVLLALMLIMGVAAPRPVTDLLHAATAVVQNVVAPSATVQ
ncbi:hydrogenase 4 subunit F [Paludibacterium purpuratum]|uniref:Hydrogenase-4 component F n=1 Tax=Paludibacterium purpuratum TaxID=1144873 RepID=A0A4R7B4U2_9NEIS|nr:hydrogenase 4 subunit F [Paludibacterium purpuratum]TDR79670.1 hydrogenase-4 component F [Paludibacterium purpuratum]